MVGSRKGGRERERKEGEGQEKLYRQAFHSSSL